MTGIQDPQQLTVASSIFEQGFSVDQISAHRMRKLAKSESVFVAIIRTMNEEDKQMNPSIVTMNEDSTQTDFPMEVQAILTEFSDVLPKDLPSALPRARDIDHQDRAGTRRKATPYSTLTYVAIGVGRAEETAGRFDRKRLHAAFSISIQGARPLCPQKGRRNPHVRGL